MRNFELDDMYIDDSKLFRSNFYLVGVGHLFSTIWNQHTLTIWLSNRERPDLSKSLVPYRSFLNRKQILEVKLKICSIKSTNELFTKLI